MAKKIPQESPPPVNGETQDALDLQDARLRLDRLHNAMQAKQQAQEAVARLQRELSQARRRLQEAEWALVLALQRERRTP